MAKSVFIISQDEPFYIPKVIAHVLANQGEDYTIIGACRLKPHRKNKTMKDWLLERTKIYTYWELFIVFHFFVYAKIWLKVLAKIGVHNPYSVKAIYQKYNIHESNTSDLNDPKFVAQLKSMNIDIVLSVSPPQLFEAPLLKVANKVCLNAHGTLLPRHRGVFGSWWMLNENDAEIGSTIHSMEEKLDAGEIVWQKAVPMPSNPTQYSIAHCTKKLLAQGIIETLGTINKDELVAIPKRYNESYHRAPTKEQGRAFHKAGKRVIKWRDAKYALAKSF